MARTTSGFKSGLVNNGSFERVPSFVAAHTTNDSYLDGTAIGSSTQNNYGWTSIVSAGTRSLQFDNTVYKSGANSLKLSSSDTTAARSIGIQVRKDSSYSDGIPIKPNTSYTFSCWYKTDTITNNNSNGLVINPQEDNAAGPLVGHVSSYKTGTNDWTAFGTTFTSGASSTYLDPQIKIVGESGTAWIDDVRLQQTARTTASARSVASARGVAA